MEIAKALKPTSLQRGFISQQARCKEILCFNVVVGEDFSVDELLDFSNGKEVHDNYEENQEKDSSLDSQDRTKDDSDSNSTGAGGFDSIFATELAVPDDDLAELEWVSHFVDDSWPELSLLYHVPSEQPRAWAEPKTEPGSSKPMLLPSVVPVKPRTTKSRKPNGRLWFFNSVPQPLMFAGLPPAKKLKKKAEAQTGGGQFQRRCRKRHNGGPVRLVREPFATLAGFGSSPVGFFRSIDRLAAPLSLAIFIRNRKVLEMRRRTGDRFGPGSNGSKLLNFESRK